CVPAFASVQKTLVFSCAYTDPGSGTLPLKIGSAASTVACGSGTAAVALDFNASGVAATTLQYGDVGKVTLTAAYSGAGGSEAGLAMSGSDTFVAMPHHFGLATIVCQDAAKTANPAASGASGARFCRAGESFKVDATAYNASNVAVPNFGKEAVPESVGLDVTLLAPVGGTAAALSGSFAAVGNNCAGNAATATACGTFSWPEVGVVSLSPRVADSNYLGAGNVSGTAASPVGRFFPHHFDTEITQACGTFTYSGQPFAVKVRARSLGGSTTTNYGGSFAGALTYSDGNAAVGAFNPTALASTKFVAGVADLTTLASDKIQFTYSDKLTKNSILRLRVAEASGSIAGKDGVSSAPGSEAVTDLRSGRLRLDSVSAYGSALQPLKMPVKTQYWSGVSWVSSTGDACTSVPTTALKVIPAGWSATGPGLLSNGAGEITLTPTANGSVKVCADLGPDPSAGVACSATSVAEAWLQSRWPALDGAGNELYNNDPWATATAGITSSERKKSIHNREMY
ncbi:MAG TPA: DUF6701 domain-containing protein, partial [Azospira sp.]|nr:DUF6701 domain-containing protein [Azospira sp.]